MDGSKTLKVYLDPKGAPRRAMVAAQARALTHPLSPPVPPATPCADKNTVEYKLDSFAGVYKRLTSRDCVFEFKE